MTLDEFESWLKAFKEDVLQYTTEQFSLSYDDLIIRQQNDNREGFFARSKKDVIFQIKFRLNKVESVEDRDFLTLKYSEYLA